MAQLTVQEIARLRKEVTEIVESVLTNTFDESRTFEFKSEFKDNETDMQRHVRQLCGLCNAAAGDIVFFVFGVDPHKRALTPTSVSEDWWIQLQNRFVEQPPHLVWSDSVSVADGLVHAFAFETARAPFATKDDGTDYRARADDRNASFEYHWRENTHRRSAKPSDLQRLLVPRQHRPIVELHEADSLRYDLGTNELSPLKSHFTIYVAPGAVDEKLELPLHRLSATVTFDDESVMRTEVHEVGREGDASTGYVSIRVDRPKILQLILVSDPTFDEEAIAAAQTALVEIRIVPEYGVPEATVQAGFTVDLRRSHDGSRWFALDERWLEWWCSGYPKLR